MKKLILALIGACILLSAYAQTDTVAATKGKFDFEKTKNPRYLSTDEIGTLIGLSSHTAKKTYFSYQTINEWQFDRHVYVGAGTGLEVSGKKGVLLDEGNSQAAIMIPLYCEIRASFLSKRVSPYLSAKTGYSFYLDSPDPSLVGGGFVEGQVGLKTFIARNASFNLSVGYRMQCLAVAEKYASQFSDIEPGYGTPGGNTKTVEYFNFLSIHAGFCY
jgi:hypothetical protein